MIARSLIAIFFLTPLAGYTFAQQLPPIKLHYASLILAADGELLDYIGPEKRVQLLSTGSVSPWVVRCLLATEDRDFYNHDGVSMKGLGRAVWNTLSGRTQGGSTLTMQLARNLFLSHDRTVSRKVREIELARQLERAYSKDQLLLLYLNTVYFGNGAYGIWAAAREYYQKDPSELTMTESAALVGLLQAPSRYNPVKHPERALRRRNEVLHNLVEVKRIRREEFERARKSSLGLKPRDALAVHFNEYVRREAESILERSGRSLRDGSYRIHTTLHPVLQRAAERAIATHWSELPSSLKEAQVALISMAPESGDILAMIGGNPSTRGQDLNRAVQIRRQPGSAFKPFLYAGLLEQGYSLATPIEDSPIVVDSGTAWEWRPANNDGTATNATVPLIHAIQHSLNLVAAHAVTELSTPLNVADFARRCGITAPLRDFPSIALGSSEVSPLDMATGFAVFASYGLRAVPSAITRIEESNRRVVYRGRADTVTVLDSATAFLMTTALQAVVDSGTGRTVRRFYSGPAAGKTGTTQQSTDAWFVGYTPSYVTAIWAGFDSPSRKLSGAYRYGSGMCAPIWGGMMAGVERELPSTDSVFVQPLNVEILPLCGETGMLAVEDCPVILQLPVNTLLLPGECDEHGQWLFGW